MARVLARGRNHQGSIPRGKLDYNLYAKEAKRLENGVRRPSHPSIIRLRRQQSTNSLLYRGDRERKRKLVVSISSRDYCDRRSDRSSESQVW